MRASDYYNFASVEAEPMELFAPRLMQEHGFAKPSFKRVMYEYYAILAREDSVLSIMMEGNSVWSFLDFNAGPRKFINLSNRVEAHIARPFSPAEHAADGILFRDVVLAWDNLLADYFAAMMWTPEHFPPAWMTGM